MRLYELSRLPERDSQSMFSTKEKKGKKNQMKKNRIECHEHYKIFMVQNHFSLPTFQDERCMHPHPKKSCS